MKLTVGELKEIIYKLPVDTIVTIERIEDLYFKNNGWKSIKVENCFDKTTEEFIEADSAYYKEKLNILCIKAHY